MDWRRLFSLNKNRNKVLRDFKKVEPIIYEILSPLDHHVGQEYFDFIAPKICELIGADYVMVGRYLSKVDQLESLSICRGKQLLENYTYDVSQSPCKDIVGKKACSMPKGAWEHFSNKLVVDNLIEGYIGIPLFSTDKSPNGVLMALYKSPINEDLKTIESLMYLFSQRLSTEIEHWQAEEEIRKRNMELELMHRALKEKNTKLDDSLEELRKAQLKSKEYDQLKSTFLANLSHEIRTPMNVILGFLELLKSNSLTSEEREEYVDIVNSNGLQLLNVMDNLIDISKLQTRLMQEDYRKVKLNDLLERLLADYKNEAKLIKKDITIDLHKGLINGKDMILTDEEGLQKVLKHLMDNALKFTRNNGHVELGYEKVNKGLRFYVKDDGVGVPEGNEKVIFDMFRQSSNTLNREFGGNGLGLAISKKYVETLGGEIWLNKNHKQGACFYFTISCEVVKIPSLTRVVVN